jgi:hypothetical protein
MKNVHVAQGKNTSNAVVSNRKYKDLLGFCPRKNWPKIAICPHFVHVNLKLWTTGQKMLWNLVHVLWTIYKDKCHHSMTFFVYQF